MLFPTDTVYGLGCDPERRSAVQRLYALKRRPAGQPAAVMFFSVASALEALPELVEAERAAVVALLPGALTLLFANRARRYPLACGAQPLTLGLRVPALDETLRPLGSVSVAVMQSSANLSGEPDARRLADVAPQLRRGVDLILDGGERPGVPSSVVDLRELSTEGRWRLVREGAVRGEHLARVLIGTRRR